MVPTNLVGPSLSTSRVGSTRVPPPYAPDLLPLFHDASAAIEIVAITVLRQANFNCHFHCSLPPPADIPNVVQGQRCHITQAFQ
jgi:hypothetical protein